MPIEPSPPHSPSSSVGAASDYHRTHSSPFEDAEWNPVDACANWSNLSDPDGLADTGSRQLSRYAGPVPVPAHMNDVDALPRLSLSSVQEPGDSRSNPEAILADWVRDSDPAVADNRQAIARMLRPHLRTGGCGDTQPGGTLLKLDNLDTGGDLPDIFRYLSGIQRLSLNNCGLRRLPESLGAMSGLREFEAGDNRLTDLPESMRDLKALQRFNVRNNELAHLPDDLFENMSKLKYLYLNENSLTTVPTSVSRCHGLELLELLDLGDNEIAGLPEGIRDLGTLIGFSLRNNKLAHLPDDLFENMSELKGLCLDDNSFTAVPTSVFRCHRLELLNLRSNEIANLPEDMRDLGSLIDLNLRSNRLTHLPDDLFENMSELKNLYLGANSLTTVPTSVSRCHRLEVLGLECNEIVDLPEGMRNLGALIEFNLAQNRLAHLPDDLFENMSELEKLYLDINRLTAVPTSVSCCHGLKVLDLRDNEIADLPESFWEFRSARPDCRVILDGNIVQLPLAETLRKWLPEGVHAPSLEGAAAEPDADSFNTWLIGLEGTADYNNDDTWPLLQQRVATLLQEMETDPDLRKMCFDCAQEAISTCEDRLTLGLHNMEMVVINRGAELGRIHEPELLQLGQGMHRLELLDNFARNIHLRQVSIQRLMQLKEIAEIAESYVKLRSSSPPGGLPDTPEAIEEHEAQVVYHISPEDLPTTPEEIEQHAQQALERTEQAASVILGHYRKGHDYSLNTAHDAAVGQARVLASLEERAALADRALEQIHAHHFPELDVIPVLQRTPRFYAGEDVETYLVCQIELKERLNLPVQNQSMVYLESTSLVAGDIDAAENYVLEEYSDAAKQVDFLSQWMPMQKHLERKHQNDYQKLCGFYDDEMNALTEQGPGEHETENDWIARMDRLSTQRSNAIAQFHREHVFSLLHSRPLSGTEPRRREAGVGVPARQNIPAPYRYIRQLLDRLIPR